MSLHDDAIVIDLHSDTLIPMRATGYRFGVRHRNPLLQRIGFYHTDLPRFLASGLTAQYFGLVTVPYPEKGCARATFRQVEMLRQAVREHDLLFARTGDDIRRAKNGGKFAALMGIEGAHNLESKVENVRAFHETGVRYIGLAHFTRNAVCTPTGGIGSDPKAPLTGFGEEVIREMNRLGMIVDLAHVAKQAFLDGANLSDKPVIVSHTGISGAYELWRNLDDDQVRAVAETDGVIGIIFAWRYLGKKRGGVEMLAPHFEHVRKLVGAKHLALGSDYDGAVEPVRGMEDVSNLRKVTRLLEGMGWTESEIRGVLGENVLRVMDHNPPVDDPVPAEKVETGTP